MSVLKRARLVPFLVLVAVPRLFAADAAKPSSAEKQAEKTTAATTKAEKEAAEKAAKAKKEADAKAAKAKKEADEKAAKQAAKAKHEADERAAKEAKASKAQPAPAAAAEPVGKHDESITFHGFTGLFNVISPDTLDGGQVSFGMTHRNYDRELNDLDVNDTAANFAIGLGSRVELGFSYVGNRQIHFASPFAVPRYNELPFPDTRIRNHGGDMTVGFKLALARIQRGGVGFTLFGQVKAPTADEEVGAGTGGWDGIGGLALGVGNGPINVYANASYQYTGDAKSDFTADIDLHDAVRYGAGVQLFARSVFRPIVEVTGEHFVSKSSFLVRNQEDGLTVTAGFKLGGTHHSGLGLGAAWQRNLNMPDRIDGRNSEPDGFVAEVSYTSYRRPLPPPPPPPPPPKVEPLNHAPTCSLSATPKEIYAAYSPKEHTAAVAVVASDPDGDPLTYTWSASGGAVSGSGPSARWNPPEGAEEGTFTVTARVADARGGETTCSDTVRVKPDAEYFEGRVLFEFDRYDLSDEARQVIERAAAQLKRYPTLKLTVEGHCCYIATEEYNLALGDRRAKAVHAYLLGQGVDEARMQTITYGETRPWQDNTREITRRLNRRGEFRFKFSE